MRPVVDWYVGSRHTGYRCFDQLPGLAFVAIGLALLQHVQVEADYVRDFLAAMLMFGVGAGIGFPALTSLAMSA